MARKTSRWRLLVKKVQNISQGSVATRLKCGKIFTYVGERILKICWHFIYDNK